MNYFYNQLGNVHKFFVTTALKAIPLNLADFELLFLQFFTRHSHPDIYTKEIF